MALYEKLGRAFTDLVARGTDTPARLTQLAVEVVEQSTDRSARVTQLAVEVVEQSTDRSARLTQFAVEVVEAPQTTPARVTQESVEVAHIALDPPARVTQESVEVVYLADDPPARVTQESVEVLMTRPSLLKTGAAATLELFAKGNIWGREFNAATASLSARGADAVTFNKTGKATTSLSAHGPKETRFHHVTGSATLTLSAKGSLTGSILHVSVSQVSVEVYGATGPGMATVSQVSTEALQSAGVDSAFSQTLLSGGGGAMMPGDATIAGSKYVAAGNTIVVLVATPKSGLGDTVTGVTDSLGNTYTKAYSYEKSGLSESKQHLYVAPVTHAGNLTWIKAAVDTAIGHWAMGSCEFAGPVTPGANSSEGGGSGTSGSTAGTDGRGLLLFTLATVGGSQMASLAVPTGYTRAFTSTGKDSYVNWWINAVLAYKIGEEQGAHPTATWTPSLEWTVVSSLNEVSGASALYGSVSQLAIEVLGPAIYFIPQIYRRGV